jgi:hypothetical protein
LVAAEKDPQHFAIAQVECVVGLSERVVEYEVIEIVARLLRARHDAQKRRGRRAQRRREPVRRRLERRDGLDDRHRSVHARGGIA